MRKRKDSHDGSPVADTNLLFVPSSSDDSAENGVDALMGMIDEAGAQPAPPPPPEVPASEARTEVMAPVVVPDTATAPVTMPPSIPPSHADSDQGTPASSMIADSGVTVPPPPATTDSDSAADTHEPAPASSTPVATDTTNTTNTADAHGAEEDAVTPASASEESEKTPSPATGEIAANLPVRRMRLPRPVYIADRITSVRRRREDAVDVVISLVAIFFIWTIGALASATTRGVTMDVLSFQLVRKILILPVSITEGLIILTTPILVIVSRRSSRSWSRASWRQSAVGSSSC